MSIHESTGLPPTPITVTVEPLQTSTKPVKSASDNGTLQVGETPQKVEHPSSLKQVDSHTAREGMNKGGGETLKELQDFNFDINITPLEDTQLVQDTVANTSPLKEVIQGFTEQPEDLLEGLPNVGGQPELIQQIHIDDPIQQEKVNEAPRSPRSGTVTPEESEEGSPVNSEELTQRLDELHLQDSTHPEPGTVPQERGEEIDVSRTGTPPTSTPAPTLQGLQAKYTDKFEIDKSPAVHLKKIKEDLAKTAEGSGAAQFKISSSLDKDNGEYAVEPYTHEKYPGLTLYKVKVTYTVQAQDASGQPIKGPDGKNVEVKMERMYFTTLPNPRAALMAVQATKNKMVELASNDQTSQELLNETKFSVSFTTDSKTGKINGVSKILTKDGTVLEVTKKNKERTYERSLGEGGLTKVEGRNYDPEEVKVRYNKEQKLARGHIKIKSNLNLLERLRQNAGGPAEFVRGVRDEAKQLEAEFEMLKAEFKQPKFLKWGSKDTDKLEDLLANIHPREARKELTEAKQNLQEAELEANKEEWKTKAETLKSELEALQQEQPSATRTQDAINQDIEAKKQEITQHYEPLQSARQRVKTLEEGLAAHQDMLNNIGRMQEIQRDLEAYQKDLKELKDLVGGAPPSPTGWLAELKQRFVGDQHSRPVISNQINAALSEVNKLIKEQKAVLAGLEKQIKEAADKDIVPTVTTVDPNQP
ncbi:hypothetical protein [Candidatus Protochlamydia phocaeensis]|uniref:hypothetical protein n=1 Tax=Candidatus Protochlamydia phocaeensis TaxID=1414722 RepID=UPI000838FEB2|nr:hypothetical protein [Candidatus Protochlamydia phocaeensis]